MFYPSLDKVKQLAQSCNLIPITMEVHADMETPISVFKRFEDSEYCFLLESAEGGEKWGRYSFIGKNPFIVVKSKKNSVIIENKTGETRFESGNPLEILQNLMEEYKSADLAGIPRFNGGAVGFFGYDLIRLYENLPDVPNDDLDLPESCFMFTNEVIVFDHLKQKLIIIVNMHTGTNIERSYNSAVARIKEIYREIQSTRWKAERRPDRQQKAQKGDFSYTSNITREQFCENVARAKEYIKNGDIFQVVLSQRLCMEIKSDPLDVYRMIRIMNPSPYMYYLKFKDFRIVGASPEMLVRVENGVVETCPIAGTRKRGATVEEDIELERSLLSDEKERAEHMMLVDLGRNDIGRVSEFGSVVAENLMHVERYSHVMHMVTNVKGKLKKGKTSFDALISIMPAGTVSGAPKIRAMQIIDELENVKRGIYAGAIGYLSFNGNLDSCITIRTIIFKDARAYVQAGAGIVADSIPENEYEETLNKAMALLKAIEKAGEIT